MTDHAPRDDLYRAMPGGITSEDGKTLTIRLAPHDQWAEIQSVSEGHFMERFGRSAYRKTMAESLPKILLNHGKDPQIGEKPIATTDEVGEDATSPFARGRLLDGVPELVVDGLRKGVYGASHRFSVVRESWVDKPAGGPHNPNKIPERTITEARLFELGPVTWPAYAGASASLRSITDDYRTLPEAPSLGAAETHPEPERRDDPAPIAAPTQERSTVDYITRDEKAARVAELAASLKRTAEEWPGVLPAAVQSAWDTDLKERQALESDIAAWDTRQAKLAEFASRDQNQSPMYEAPVIHRQVEDIYDIDAIRRRARSFEEVESLTRDNALRSLEAARVPSGSLDGLSSIVEREDEGEEGKGEIARRVLLTGSPVYKRAFNKYLRGQTALWSPEEARAAALAVTGTTTTGGYAVPYVFDPTMIHIGAWTQQNPYRAACRIETITNGNNWRAVTVGAVTAAYGTEAAAQSEGGPTFGQPTYTVQTASAFATVSFETMQDRPDISGELTAVFAEAKDTLEENQFSVGTGATVYPAGMFYAGSYTPTNTASNDTTVLSDTQLIENAVPLRYRMHAEWFMNRSTLRQLLALDTTYRYFSGAGLQFAGDQNPTRAESGNTGMRLLGYPIWEVPSAVATLTTDQALIACLVDPKSYIIVDRLGMNVEVIQNMTNGATPSFPTLQRGVLCYWRNTAKPVNADAGRMLRVQ